MDSCAVSVATAVGSAIIHDAADELFRCRSRASTSMRSAHLKQDRFDASPGAGPFAFASLFKSSGLLSGLSDGLESVGFPELPRVLVYFHGLHGFALLFLQHDCERASVHGRGRL